MAQELLSTFGADLGEVALIPGTGGVFQIAYEGDVLWDRKRDEGLRLAEMAYLSEGQIPEEVGHGAVL